MVKRILRRLNKIIRYDAVRWNIGFADCTPQQLIDTGKMGEVKWVKHNLKESWFADPFILNVTDSHYDVLVEEMDVKKNRGKISRLIIDRRTMEIASQTTILELTTHLSFPHIVSKGDSLFFYPENGESESLDLYRFSPVNNTVIKEKNLISGEKIVDAQMLEIDGRHYILGTIKPNQSKDIVTVFESDSFDGKYKKSGTFTVAPTSARGAGEIFKCNGKFIRPSQDSAKGYGNGVVLSEITCVNGQFSNREIRRIYPEKDSPFRDGLHTVNFFQDSLLVIDGYNFNKRFLALAINKLRKLLQ